MGQVVLGGGETTPMWQSHRINHGMGGRLKRRLGWAKCWTASVLEPPRSTIGCTPGVAGASRTRLGGEPTDGGRMPRYGLPHSFAIGSCGRSDDDRAVEAGRHCQSRSLPGRWRSRIHGEAANMASKMEERWAWHRRQKGRRRDARGYKAWWRALVGGFEARSARWEWSWASMGWQEERQARQEGGRGGTRQDCQWGWEEGPLHWGCGKALGRVARGKLDRRPGW